MLTAQFEAQYKNGQKVNLAYCCCSVCDNIWLVPEAPENDAIRYCPYCGVKFTKLESSEGDVRHFDPNTE